ncbi:MAG: ATPase [Alphaproteobacteria bacterium]|nr:ATPase [Alphaproteobacteria bacterium]
MTSSSQSLSRQSEKLLALLACEGAYATQVGEAGGAEGEPLAVFIQKNGVSLRQGSAPPAAVSELVSCGAARWTQGAASGRRRLALTGAGHALRLRLTSEEPGEAFRAQHGGLANAQVETAGVERRVRMASSESPLAWLAARKDSQGRPLIGSAELAAGERLRADLTLAQIMPRITANWTAEVASGARGAGAMNISDTAIAARQRVDQALAAAGVEFSGLLIDVCGFLKGLELIEIERGWPRRSARVILAMALAALARHYGFCETISGASAKGRLRHWGVEDYRPQISVFDSANGEDAAV